MAKRSDRVRTLEHRLILLIFPRVLAVVSLLLYGFTADGNSTWGGPYMGWTLLQVTFVSVLIQSIYFAAEAWENPGPALVAVVGTMNIIAFGISYTAMGILPVTAGIFLPGFRCVSSILL